MSDERDNDFGVSLHVDSGDIAILMLNARMPREKALRLAAWIVALADPLRKDFDRILTAIMGGA